MATGRDDCRVLGWSIAGAPLLAVVLAMLAGRSVDGISVGQAVGLGWSASALVATWLAVFHRTRRRAAARPETAALWAALLCGWPYLALDGRRQGAPARVTRVTRRPATVGLAALLLALAATVPLTDAVTRPRLTFDRVRLNADLAAAIRAQTGLPVTVSCPADASQSAGTLFACAVTGAGGSTSVDVTVEDDTGRYSWRLD